MTHSSAPAMPVYSLLLAAGSSSRFGGNKLMAELNGRPILAHVAATLAEAITGGILTGGIAVIPAGGTSLMWVLDTAGLQIIENGESNAGFASSLKLGIATIAELASTNRQTAEPPYRSAAVLVVLADQPNLRVDVIARLVESWRSSGKSARPRYSESPANPGHPVLLDQSLWPLAQHLSGDTGLRDLLNGREVQIVDIEGSNPDVDRPEDLRRLEGEPKTGGKRSKGE